MKISEFKRKMDQLAFEVKRGEGNWLISTPNEWGTATINMTTDSYGICNLPLDAAMLVAQFANTPIDERDDDRRWHIIIGQDVDKDGELTIWRKPYYNGAVEDSFIDAEAKQGDLDEPTTIFTDFEVEQLLTRLKALERGDIYAKIVELGKREVVADEN